MESVVFFNIGTLFNGKSFENYLYPLDYSVFTHLIYLIIFSPWAYSICTMKWIIMG